MKTIILHHIDSDGVCAGAIANSVYLDAECIPVNYGTKLSDTLLEKIKDSRVIIVDFSFPQDIFVKISSLCKELIWIDHHMTAINSIDITKFSKVPNCKLDTTKSGCLLAWEYFYSKFETPAIVDFINDYDMWKFESGNTKAVNEYISTKFINEDCTFNLIGWNNLLFPTLSRDPFLGVFKTFPSEIISGGNTLLLAKAKRIHKAFDDGVDIDFFGNKARMVNTNVDISEMGEYIYKEKKYPVAIIWSVRRDKIIVSLRSDSIDVGELAKKMGGGGHKFSAGFNLGLDRLQEFISGRCFV